MTLTKNERLTTPHSQPSKALTNHTAIVSASEPERNEFTEVAKAFACRGHDLSRLESESRVSYFVTSRGRALIVTSWLAVKTLLEHVKGAA